MRYFTHRNKAGKDLVAAYVRSLYAVSITVKRVVGPQMTFLNDSPDIHLDWGEGKEVRREIGTGVPGRWWQEITEERAKELLGGGAR